jgi:hypothetical protein
MFTIHFAANRVSASIALSLCLLATGCGRPDKASREEAGKRAAVEAQVGVLASRFGAGGDLTGPAVFTLLRRHLEENPEIYGAAFAFAPVERDGALIKSSPYVFRSGGDTAGFVEKDLALSYDYATEAWYAEPVKVGKALWSAPYFDAGGGEIWMVTYSVPVYDSESRLVGVVTSDLPTEER